MDDDDLQWEQWEQDERAEWLAWHEQSRGNDGTEKDRAGTPSSAIRAASDQPFA
jgi:hypothetical protein